MTSTSAPVPPPRVSCGGAWLGFFVAAWAAVSVAASALLPATVALLPWLFDTFTQRTERQSGAGWADLPPEARKLFDLLFELPQILGPYSRIVGATGVVLGLALFVAATALVAGSETGRRATRALLVLSMLRTAGATAWAILILANRGADWIERFRQAVEALATAIPRGPGNGLSSLQVPAAVNAVGEGLAGCVGLAVLATLLCLAGRPFAREWCAARNRKQPIATGSGPR